MILQKIKVRNVKGVSEKDIEKIKIFFQGAVYSWCKNKPTEWFSLRDLMGGENFDWNGSPLIVLYEKHICKGKSNKVAINRAGVDAGWLLMASLKSDKRKFKTKVEYVRKYKWVK